MTWIGAIQQMDGIGNIIVTFASFILHFFVA